MEDIQAFSIAESALNLIISDMPEEFSSILNITESVVFNGRPHVLVFADDKLAALKLKEYFNASVQIRLSNGELHNVTFEAVTPRQPEGMN